MQSFDRPTVITGGSTGTTEPRSAESPAQARMIEALKAATSGEFEIVRELGRGGMAIVYQAHDLSLDREVAIKVMSPALLDGEGAIERFKREARTAAGLSHPHIIPIHAVREAGDVLYFVMKFIEGRPLDAVLQREGALAIPMVVQILSEVAGALAYAHKRGVIHRDIKPPNIMLDDGGWAVVADFGIAKVTEKRGLTMTGMTVGTPAYMSPEQFTLKDLDGRSDQYSLGIVAFELLTGRTPFAADSMVEMFMAHSSTAPPPVRSIRSDCPPELARIVERMIAKKPADRYPSLDDVVQELSSLQTTEGRKQVRNSLVALAKLDASAAPTVVQPVPSGPTAVTAPVRTPARGRRSTWFAAAALVVVAVALGAWYQSKKANDLVVTPAGSGGPVVPPRAPVVKIDLAPTATLSVNGTAPLQIALRDSLDRVVTGRSVQWTSSDTSIATVDSAGVVHARRAGRATVVASSEGRSASSIVDVTEQVIVARSVTLSAPDSSVDAGTTLDLIANVRDNSGTNLIGRAVEWKSSDPAVASVDPASGAVSALKPGTTTITASIRNGPRSALELTVSAPRAVVANVTLSQSSFALTAGDTANPRATVTDARNAVLGDRPVTWTSDHPDIVQVDRVTGRAIALREGDARIVASVDSISRGIDVTVKRAAAAAVTPKTEARSDSTTVAPPLAGPTFTEISAGGATTCGALANDGGLLCWGAAGLNGTLQQGMLFTKVSVGDSHTCGLTPSGEAQCWGKNSLGQLGDGTTTDRDKPVTVQGNLVFTDISVGAAHTCGLTADGSAYCWGSNKSAQLGDGSQSDRKKPVLVKSTAGNRSFQSIAAGGAHTCAVSKANRAFCWGDGMAGQVGNSMPDIANEPFAVKTDLEFKRVVAGNSHTCGLTTKGHAYCWGNNRDGELGNENKDDRDKPDSVATDQIFLSIASGSDHVCAISSQKKLYCWGKNADGRLGDGSRVARTTPVLSGGGQTFTLVSAGSGHTCALTTRGQAMCWGTNSRGQLGTGATSAFSPAPLVVRVKGGG
jgi:alpha-tubulin suppressor-like RCC1 family protein/uncharacterized protein YjdB